MPLQRRLSVAQHDQKTDGGDHQFEEQHQAQAPHRQQAAERHVGAEVGRGPVLHEHQRHDRCDLQKGHGRHQHPAKPRRVGAHAVEHLQGAQGLQHRDHGLHAIEADEVAGQVQRHQGERADQRQHHDGRVTFPVGTLPKALQRNGEGRNRRADENLCGDLQLHHAEPALQRKARVRKAAQRGAQHRFCHALTPMLAAQDPHHPRDRPRGKSDHAKRGQEVGFEGVHWKNPQPIVIFPV